jgi:hypothetical protein
MFHSDERLVLNGRTIPTESGYADQPSLVKAVDGSWVCSVTTGRGGEGSKGQFVNITRSYDQGQTWTEPIALEPSPWESAYSSLTVAPSGRIYCFYCYNLLEIDVQEAGLERYDMGGVYCFRVSIDNGVTWSNRYSAHIRDFAIDACQQFQEVNGKPLKFFWNVSRIWFDGNVFYSPVIKYSYMHHDVIHSSEGVLLRCDGLDDGYDGGYANVKWETLPSGDTGVRAPAGGGYVAEEQSYVTLSDSSLFCTFRTIDGHPAGAISRDGGYTFEPSEYLRYADGRQMKHNRAATFIWPLRDGKYFYWFNNHGERWYARRNPIWCAIASEVETPAGLTLRFGQPEILLYHPDPRIGMSYPDLLEDGGVYYITETEKRVARVHLIDPGLLSKMINVVQATDTPIWSAERGRQIPTFPNMAFLNGNPQQQRVGYTMLLSFDAANPGDCLFSGAFRVTLDADGKGLVLLEEEMANCAIHSSISLADGQPHRFAIQMDVSANIIMLVIDGVLDDGGNGICGWRYLNAAIQTIPGGKVLLGETVSHAALYGRCLLNAEAAVLL